MSKIEYLPLQPYTNTTIYTYELVGGIVLQINVIQKILYFD